MTNNHTHNNDSGSIHYICKKILDFDIIKEAFAIIPLRCPLLNNLFGGKKNNTK